MALSGLKKLHNNQVIISPFTGRYEQVTQGEVLKYLAPTQELCLKISVI